MSPVWCDFSSVGIGRVTSVFLVLFWVERPKSDLDWLRMVEESESPTPPPRLRPKVFRLSIRTAHFLLPKFLMISFDIHNPPPPVVKDDQCCGTANGRSPTPAFSMVPLHFFSQS